jgi:hypothetical protein
MQRIEPVGLECFKLRRSQNAMFTRRVVFRFDDLKLFLSLLIFVWMQLLNFFINNQKFILEWLFT